MIVHAVLGLTALSLLWLSGGVGLWRTAYAENPTSTIRTAGLLAAMMLLYMLGAVIDGGLPEAMIRAGMLLTIAAGGVNLGYELGRRGESRRQLILSRQVQPAEQES